MARRKNTAEAFEILYRRSREKTQSPEAADSRAGGAGAEPTAANQLPAPAVDSPLERRDPAATTSPAPVRSLRRPPPPEPVLRPRGGPRSVGRRVLRGFDSSGELTTEDLSARQHAPYGPSSRRPRSPAGFYRIRDVVSEGSDGHELARRLPRWLSADTARYQDRASREPHRGTREPHRDNGRGRHGPLSPRDPSETVLEGRWYDPTGPLDEAPYPRGPDRRGYGHPSNWGGPPGAETAAWAHRQTEYRSSDGYVRRVGDIFSVPGDLPPAARAPHGHEVPTGAGTEQSVPRESVENPHESSHEMSDVRYAAPPVPSVAMAGACAGRADGQVADSAPVGAAQVPPLSVAASEQPFHESPSPAAPGPAPVAVSVPVAALDAAAPVATDAVLPDVTGASRVPAPAGLGPGESPLREPARDPVRRVDTHSSLGTRAGGTPPAPERTSDGDDGRSVSSHAVASRPTSASSGPLDGDGDVETTSSSVDTSPSVDTSSSVDTSPPDDSNSATEPASKETPVPKPRADDAASRPQIGPESAGPDERELPEKVTTSVRSSEPAGSGDSLERARIPLFDAAQDVARWVLGDGLSELLGRRIEVRVGTLIGVGMVAIVINALLIVSAEVRRESEILGGFFASSDGPSGWSTDGEASHGSPRDEGLLLPPPMPLLGPMNDLAASPEGGAAPHADEPLDGQGGMAPQGEPFETPRGATEALASEETVTPNRSASGARAPATPTEHQPYSWFVRIRGMCYEEEAENVLKYFSSRLGYTCRLEPETRNGRQETREGRPLFAVFLDEAFANKRVADRACERLKRAAVAHPYEKSYMENFQGAFPLRRAAPARWSP